VNIYYRNAFKGASFSMTNLEGGETAADITQQDTGRTVQCGSQSAVVTALWTPQAARIANALFVSNTNALQGALALYDQNLVYTRTVNFELGRLHNKIEFPAQAVGKLELALEAAGENLFLGLLFLDLGIALPRFTVGVDMSDEIRGTAGRSDSGQSWGISGASLETFSASWKRVTEAERHIMRMYIDDVQFNVNHYISPYDGIDMYVTLTEAGKWAKHDGNGFYWDTNLKYREAK
jgi:hypothetical protein